MFQNIDVYITYRNFQKIYGNFPLTWCYYQWLLKGVASKENSLNFLKICIISNFSYILFIVKILQDSYNHALRIKSTAGWLDLLLGERAAFRYKILILDYGCFLLQTTIHIFPEISLSAPHPQLKRESSMSLNSFVHK